MEEIDVYTEYTRSILQKARLVQLQRSRKFSKQGFSNGIVFTDHLRTINTQILIVYIWGRPRVMAPIAICFQVKWKLLA